jgi:hypothetical protein
MGKRSSTQFDPRETLAKLWPFAGEIRGKVGDVMFRRFNGKTIICRAPKPRSTPPTEAQVAHTKKFGEAATEAKRLLHRRVHPPGVRVLAQTPHIRVNP